MQPFRRITAVAAVLMMTLAFTIFRPPPTPGPLERDFEAYYAAGATVNARADPYSRRIWNAERRIPGVNARHDEVLPFVGPAAGLPFWSALARLPYGAAVVVWTTLLVGALGVVVFAALHVARAPGDPLLIGLAAAVSVASAPMIGALALGQAALAAAASVAGALVAYQRRDAVAAAGATLLAALQPNLAPVLAARLRSRWDLAVAASAGAVFAALTLAAGGGVSGFLGYLLRLGAHAKAERGIAIQHTPASIAYAFGLPLPATPALTAAIAVLAAGAAVLIIVRERLDPTTATLVAGALLPFAIPFFHEPDFVLELLPVLVLALRARGRARGLAAIAAVLVLVDWFGLAQRPAAQAQILCLGGAVAFGFAGLRGTAARDRRADWAGPAALATLALVAAPLGRFHAAPTWPDMLPAGFHAAPAADASSVWAAEARAAGLTKREPAWGLLRGLPLAGCLVLAAALVEDARARRRRTAAG